MESTNLLVCELGGRVNSKPEILISYPQTDLVNKQSTDLLEKCLPLGAKVGEFILNKYQNHKILSYVFKITKQEERDDLLSISIAIDKKGNENIYKSVLEELIIRLEKNKLLNEDILKEYQKAIYEGLKNEEDIKIDFLDINLSKIFKENRKKFDKSKPKLKGSFF
ncbi:MAG: hypothetical protein ACOC44_02535 [Promethearchaeia archaeon]